MNTKGTHRIRVLDLPPYVQVIFLDDGSNAFGENHVVILFFAEKFIVALHDAMKAGSKEAHVL